MLQDLFYRSLDLRNTLLAPRKVPGKSAVNRRLLQLDRMIGQGIPLPDLLQEMESAKREMLERLQGFFPSGYDSALIKLALIKILNLLVAKQQFLARSSDLVAKPFGLIIDPANGCNLHCPGCIHSPTIADNFVWPNGNLSEGTYRRFLDSFGFHACKICFSNCGEPLLNRNTPQMIRIAKGYGLQTFLSTNFSVKIDAQELVASGIDYLTLAIDGTTPETHRRYRRGGDFDLVVDNIRRVVAARKSAGSVKPYLIWRFLLFTHTTAEMDAALKLARELGIDELHFARPYAVDWDEPSIVVDTATPERIVTFSLLNKIRFHSTLAAPGEITDRSGIDRVFDNPWGTVPTGEPPRESGRPAHNTCEWLYKNVVMDAQGRILPCCYPPVPEKGSVFGTVAADGSHRDENLFNTGMYRSSREHFARDGGGERVGGSGESRCIGCRPATTLGVDNAVLRNFLHTDGLFRFLNSSGIRALSSGW